MKRIGILGGTFNPIHSAHIMLAETAGERLQLDRVLIMPSNNPPHKANAAIASDEDRSEMVRLAIKGHERLEYSDFEMKREGITYTSDTLNMLTSQNPDTRYFFIIGADSLFKFTSWHEPADILRHCALVCSGRAAVGSDEVRTKIEEIRDLYTDGDFIPEIYYIEAPSMEISSESIRKLISFEMPSAPYLAPEVYQYIQTHKLYQNSLYEAIKADLGALLKPSRYAHVISVAQTAVNLAVCVGIDPEKPYLAGLLHDCAKYLSDEDMIKAAEDNSIELDPIERRAVQLVHAKVGEVFAKTKYGVDDPDILSAIRYHTTGKPEMSMLEKIIYIADTIEPLRTWGDDDELNIIRSIATSDIDRAVYIVLKRTYEFITRKYADNVSDETVKTYNFYKDLYNRRKGQQ
ncbi:MAG: nicotinate-nucleotide adenylyltransferase [Lachnospiraceae bacterium]|nr:nicotinate-nucleotide adenylyltransferase [Lachnospiraceae bacterium]